MSLDARAASRGSTSPESRVPSPDKRLSEPRFRNRRNSHREPDRERGADAVAALHLHVAAESLEQLSRYAETQAGTAKFARPRLIDLPEVLPDRVEVLLLDADAAVAHDDPHIIVVACRVETHPAHVRELDGVRQQVEQDLFQLRAIGVDEHPVV